MSERVCMTGPNLGKPCVYSRAMDQPYPRFCIHCGKPEPASESNDTPLVAPKTYCFTTLQELLNVVPTDRIATCMHELAVIMTEAKAISELIYATAVELAKKEGVPVPPPIGVGAMVTIPQPFEWLDDGKGTLETHFKHPVTGKEMFMTKIQLNEEQQDTTGGS